MGYTVREEGISAENDVGNRANLIDSMETKLAKKEKKKMVNKKRKFFAVSVLGSAMYIEEVNASLSYVIKQKRLWRFLFFL